MFLSRGRYLRVNLSFVIPILLLHHSLICFFFSFPKSDLKKKKINTIVSLLSPTKSILLLRRNSVILLLQRNPRRPPPTTKSEALNPCRHSPPPWALQSAQPPPVLPRPSQRFLALFLGDGDGARASTELHRNLRHVRGALELHRNPWNRQQRKRRRQFSRLRTTRTAVTPSWRYGWATLHRCHDPILFRLRKVTRGGGGTTAHELVLACAAQWSWLGAVSRSKTFTREGSPALDSSDGVAWRERDQEIKGIERMGERGSEIGGWEG